MNGVVSMKARAFESGKRTTMDVIVVLDVSGSMEGDKLALAKKTLSFLLKNMRAADSFGLVTYSEVARVAIPLAAMSARAKESAENTIRAIGTEGRTNLSGGLLKAVEMMNARASCSAVASILLMTDGQANVGITGEAELGACVDSVMATRAAPFSIYTFGYGADHNAPLLKRVSDSGQGMYYFVESVDTIPQSFADCLGGLMSTVGQNLTLTLTALGGATLARVRTKRTFTLSVDRTVAQIAMGDLQSEEERDVLFQLALAPLDAPCEEQPCVRAQVTFFDVLGVTFSSQEAVLCVARPADAPDGAVAHVKVVQQRARADTTDAMEESMAAAKRGDMAAAMTPLKDALARISLIDDLYCRELCDDLRNCIDGVKDRASFASRGTYTMSSAMQTHEAQRCNAVSHSRGYTSYTTSSRDYMRERATEEGEDS